MNSNCSAVLNYVRSGDCFGDLSSTNKESTLGICWHVDTGNFELMGNLPHNPVLLFVLILFAFLHTSRANASESLRATAEILQNLYRTNM